MKKIAIIVIVAVLFVLMAAAAVIFFFFGKKTVNQPSLSAVSIASYRSSDGRIIQPKAGGELVEFDKELVYRSVLTPDRSKIVVQTQNNELYYINADGSGKTMITAECEHLESLFSGVYEKGVIYVDRSGSRHRYLFESALDAKMSEDAGPIMVSDKNLHLAYAANDGVYLLTEESENPKKIKQLEGNNAAIISVSNDGKRLLWYELDDDNKNIYLHINDENIKIDSSEREKGYAVTPVNNEQQSYTVVGNPAAGKLYIIGSEGEIETVSVENSSIVLGKYTVNNIVNHDSEEKFSGLYFAARTKNVSTVYYIDKDYNYEPVIEDVRAYAVYDGYIYYIDADNDLVYGKLNKSKISDKKTIDNNVGEINDMLLNGYLYYIKDVNPANREGSMYVYKIGEKPVKIDTGIVADFYDTYITADGKTVVYLKNLILHESNIIGATGTLCRYSIGEGEPEKIDSKVIRSSMHPGYKDRFHDGKSFIYKKSISADKNSVTGDLYYFDGKERKKLAEDVF